MTLSEDQTTAASGEFVIERPPPRARAMAPSEEDVPVLEWLGSLPATLGQYEAIVEQCVDAGKVKHYASLSWTQTY